MACVGLRPGVRWAMAGRAESSLSEVRLRKVSAFIPTTSEPSSSSRPGAVSWGGKAAAWGSGGENVHPPQK